MSENLKEIADRIREVREIKGFTMEQAASKLSIDVETYSQYEDASKGIPISALYEMAGIFGVEFTELLTGTSPRLHNFCLVKNGEAIDVERYKGYKFQSLAYNFVNKKIEPLLVTVEPVDNCKISLVAHPGQEFNYVLEGRIKVVLGGNEVEMGPGDSLYFDPEIPHCQNALDGKPAKFLTVILHEK